jgi:hypothetical protein
MVQTPDGRFLYVTVGRANEVVMIEPGQTRLLIAFRQVKYRRASLLLT